MQSAHPTGSAETVCDHRSEAGPYVTHARGTLLASSLETLKQAGHYERYREALPASLHDQVLYVLAHSWVPIELAVAHYEACDALALGAEELDNIGKLVAERLANTFLTTLVRAARDAGIDAPFIALRSQGRIWDRLYMGGGVKILRLGPKDAFGEFYGLPLSQIPYFRQAFCAYYRALAQMFTRRAYVNIVRAVDPQPTTLALRGSWT